MKTKLLGVIINYNNMNLINNPFNKIIMCLMLYPLTTFGAAPNDINSSQRAWFDATDINANGVYTDNPANSSSISQWNDKSGLAHNITSSGTANPTYLTNNPATQRNAVRFDGNNDFLGRPDIWNGNVNTSEIFVMASTDAQQNSFLFASMANSTRRLSTHIPWGNGATYFDHGNCCTHPARISGNISITITLPYNWHYIGNANLQAVVQDGATMLSDSGVGTYVPSATSQFTLARNAAANNNFHNGRIFEFIAYQRELNIVERKILNSYLSAKWNKPFASSPTYADVYSGDNSANGDYDYFVGGIGQENGTQSTGTSQGLTITNNSFLTANGKYVLAGVNYLTTTPATGTVTADLPSGYTYRSNRSWYIDTTGSGGTVNLSFNASEIGLPIVNGEEYGLLHRSGTSGTFTEVSTAVMSGGTTTFNHLPADGIYTIAKKSGELSLLKTSCVINDNLNTNANAKRIPGSTIRYMFEVKNYTLSVFLFRFS